MCKELSLKELQQRDTIRCYYDLSDQLRRYIERKFRAAHTQGIKEKESRIFGKVQEIEKRKEAVRTWFLESIGGLPDVEGNPHAEVRAVHQFDSYRVENIVFCSRKEVYVTANLYIPSGDEPVPVVLFLPGHAAQAKCDIAYMEICTRIVQAGIAVLAIDPVGQGERYSYIDRETGTLMVPNGCPEHDHVGVQCWLKGDSCARYFLHDAIRALDYLCTRPEIDTRRIGVAGNSGGATQTGMLLMTDSRIQAAVCATYLTDMLDYLRTGIVQDAEQIFVGLTEKGFDLDDVLLCHAPKPMLVFQNLYDYFPIEGTRKVFRRAKRIWKTLGNPDALETCVVRDEHVYNSEMAVQTADFFSRVFLGRPARNLPLCLPTAQELMCTAKGQVALEFSDARFLFDENLERSLKTEEDETKRKELARAFLQHIMDRRGEHAAGHVRRFLPVRVQGMEAEAMLWWRAPGLMGAAMCFTQPGQRYKVQPTVLAVWDRGTDALCEHEEWIVHTCASGKRVVVLDVSGEGALLSRAINTKPLYAFEGTYCWMQHALFWLGDSLPALHLRDVACAAERLRAEFGCAESLSLYAAGRIGAQALAACFALGWKDVVYEGTAPSMKNIVNNRTYDDSDCVRDVLPGMLTFFDYPDLVRWF